MSFSKDIPVVLAASAPYDTPAPVNAHQVARRLARRGHRVLFVESTGLRAPAPLSARHDLARIARRLRNFAGGLRQVERDLWVLSPLALPGGGPAWLRRHSLGLLAGQVARAARALDFARPVVWAFLPTAVGLPDRLDARALVYHCVDHYAANPGVDAVWIDRLERAMLGRADVVFATSPVLADRLRERARCC